MVAVPEPRNALALSRRGGGSPDLSPRETQSMTPKQSARATPDAFGAGVARAIDQFGQGIGAIGDWADAKFDERDEIAAREAEIEARRSIRALEIEYLDRKQRGAIDSWSDFEQRLSVIQKNATGGRQMSPQAAERVQMAVDTLSGETWNRGGAHRLDQSRAYQVGLSETRIEEGLLSAVARPGDTTALSQARRTARTETATISRLKGWDAEQQAFETEKRVSGVTKASIIALAERDPMAAEALLNGPDGKALRSDDRVDVENTLRPLIRDRRIISESDRIMSMPADAGALSSLPRFEGVDYALGGRRAPTPENRAHMRAVHERAVAAAPAMSDGLRSALPNLDLDKWSVGDKVVIDREFAARLNGALGAVKAAGGEVEFAPYNMVNVLDYRLENGGVRPGVLLNTPHLVGRAADIRIRGVAPETVKAISDKYGLGLVTPTDYEKRGAGFQHYDFSLTDRRATAAYQNPTISLGEQLAEAARIEDPDEREGIERRIRAAHQDAKRIENEAIDQLERSIYTRIELGEVSTRHDLTGAERIQLGPEGLARVESYLDTTQGRTPPPKSDNMTLWFELDEMATNDPTRFASYPLQRHIGELTPASLKALRKRQAKPEALAPDKIMTGAVDALFASRGVVKASPADARKKPETAQPYVRATALMTELVDQFRADPANKGRSPSETELLGLARRTLREVQTQRDADTWWGDDEFKAIAQVTVDDAEQMRPGRIAEIQARLKERGLPSSESDALAVFQLELIEASE